MLMYTCIYIYIYIIYIYTHAYIYSSWGGGDHIYIYIYTYMAHVHILSRTGDSGREAGEGWVAGAKASARLVQVPCSLNEVGFRTPVSLVARKGTLIPPKKEKGNWNLGEVW